MRTVKGKTDRVVVVGAGLSGLSAALYLAGRGRSVTVVEREPHPGGRVGRADVNGYHLDMGPTVLTMPDIIDDAMAAVGIQADRPPRTQPGAPGLQRGLRRRARPCRCTPTPRAMTPRSNGSPGREEADGYRRLRAWLTGLYAAEFDGFIGANFDSPLSLLTPQLARLARDGRVPAAGRA